MSFKPKTYTVKRATINQATGEKFYKTVGTISMGEKGGKLWLNMFDEEYGIYPNEAKDEDAT